MTSVAQTTNQLASAVSSWAVATAQSAKQYAIYGAGKVAVFAKQAFQVISAAASAAASTVFSCAKTIVETIAQKAWTLAEANPKVALATAGGALLVGGVSYLLHKDYSKL